MNGNQLSQATSPYLKQHADNPVHWQVWGEDAFADAKARNVPIILSVGYAACHWCHVMAHESFEDSDTADQMNRDFVAIKVDREEHPEVDAIYQQALSMFGQQGGWPLTMFLTPEGRPFWGGTYYPPLPAHGRPSFRDVMQQMATLYRSDPDKIADNVKKVGDALSGLATAQAGEVPFRAVDLGAQGLARQVDPFFGGFGNAPKFPQASSIESLWRGHRRTGHSAYTHLTDLTMRHLMQGGIYDHVGGGMARYAVDERWLVPHFEKMLYDNAQVLDLLSLIGAGSGDKLWAQRASEIVGWLEREMLITDGEAAGFAASLDADSLNAEGKSEEGAYYTWSMDEVMVTLGPEEAQHYAHHYDITVNGNFEDRSIPNRLHLLDWLGDDEEARLRGLNDKLLTARQNRTPPGRDDKVLADWNGMMITALCHAATSFDQPGWTKLAAGAFDFIVTHHSASDGVLHHSWADGRQGDNETLDDYAHMTMAAIALYEATGRESYLDHAADWVRQVLARFRDPDSGALFTAPKDAARLITRLRPVHDNAVPAATAVMASALIRLSHLTGDQSYAQHAGQAINSTAGDLNRNLLAAAALLNAVEFRDRPIQIVIIGPLTDPDTQALLTACAGFGHPDKIISQTEPGSDLPATHPAQGKTAQDGKATAYVCVGQQCSLPIMDAEILAANLQKI
ncbi:yyaL [Symbiodinium microadriaticum]|nr:yyaL [Symbiodinium microadriaticum]